MIDANKINEFVENATRPVFCEVSEEDWRNALLGAQEAFSNTNLEGLDTDSLWSTIYFSAVYFCKGMMWAEVKAGLRKESNYPRY